MKYYLSLCLILLLSFKKFIVAVDIPDNIFLTNLIDVKYDEANSTCTYLSI